MRLKHKIALFVVYLTLFSALSAMVDYYAYDILNPWIFIFISFVLAIGATLIHARSHKKSKADELAKDVEKIL